MSIEVLPDGEALALRAADLLALAAQEDARERAVGQGHHAARAEDEGF